MESNYKKYIIWAIRIISAGLFVLSAVSKLSIETIFDKPAFAIYNFERNFLTEGLGFEAGLAQVFSRLLIGIEFAIAVLLLLPFFVKKLVIPGTILLLAAFTIHLGIQAAGGDSSNCGCFGSFIEMSPLESVFKNIISIILLVLLITRFKDDWEDKSNVIPVLGIGGVFVLLMFVMVPQKEIDNSANASVVSDEEGQFESGYSEFFEDIDQGEKLLCFFSPTCDHCMATGKEIAELQVKYPELIPEVRVLFMDEADNGSAMEIQAYFDFVGQEFQYDVLTIEEFIPIFFADYNFPGVMYLKNGEQKLFFNGTEDEEFNAEQLLEALKN